MDNSLNQDNGLFLNVYIHTSTMVSVGGTVWKDLVGAASATVASVTAHELSSSADNYSPYLLNLTGLLGGARNGTRTHEDGGSPTAAYGLGQILVTLVVLGTIILAAVIGNVFVIAAVLLERNLHNVANYLVTSLAGADLMVATLVMPLAAVNEVIFTLKLTLF